MNFPYGRHIVIVALLVLLAGGVRIWGIGLPATYIGDEAAQVPAARAFVASGNSDGTFWHHPPLGLILLDGTIRLFGDNPYGWRMRNVLAGALLVAVVFFLAVELFADRRGAFLAGLIVALDPLHITVSRMTTDEIPAALFFFIAWLATLRYVRGRSTTPLLAGIAAGLSLATKPYYGPALLVLFVYAWRRRGESTTSLAARLHLVLVFVLVPVTVYILSYLPWFGRGYGLGEFVRFVADSYRDLSLMTPEWFRFDSVLRQAGGPGRWFTLPSMVGMEISADGPWRQYVIYLNDPPVWFLTLPACIYALLQTRREDSPMALSPLILFLAAYLPLLAVSRPIYLYSATAVFPFAAILIAAALQGVADRFRMRRLLPLFTVALFAWGAYTYPLATRKTVPFSLYRPLIDQTKIIRTF